MPSRHFARVAGELITMGIGSLGFAFGPGTWAGIVKRNSDLDDPGVIGVGAATDWAVFFEVANDYISFYNGAATVDAAIPFVTADGWCLLGVTKATGTVAPRIHKYVYGTGQWTHANATGTVANSGVPATSFTIGDGNAKLDAEMKIQGVWDFVLTDAQFETLPFRIKPWLTVGQPRTLLPLEQSSTSIPVLDLGTVPRATQTAISGTSIYSGAEPSWNFGFDPGPPDLAGVTTSP